MYDPIPDPVSGKFVIEWALPVTRRLNALHDKVGAPARNERDRRTTVAPHPYEVRWDSSLNSGGGGWKIYLPTEHLLSYAGEDIATSDIDGATVIQANNADTPWYSLDDIDTAADHVWLVITITDPSSEGADPTVEAEFAAEEGQAATGEKVVNVCIAEISYTAPSSSGESATIEINQSVVGALHLGVEENPVEPDDKSIEKIPASEEGETPTDDEGKLQIFDFNSDESDSPEGLVERLRADPETGEVTLKSGTNIMLVARRNGEVVYIPLSAPGKDEEDEKPYDPENPDPCEHPGDKAGGSETSDAGSGGGGGVSGDGGGVLADGDVHAGDDNCNCN